MSERSLRGLYAIADTGLLPAGDLIPRARAVLQGGASLLQYRDKKGDPGRRLEQAQTLCRLCHEYGRLFVINDDPELAAASGADGVHLGRDDTAIDRARALLGPGALVGLSCYNELGRAIRAEREGADYVAFGRFFPSRTKPGAIPAPVELLRQARATLHVPIVAIGGITPANGAVLLAAGADMLAAIHGLFGQPDPAAAAHAYHRLFLPRRMGPVLLDATMRELTPVDPSNSA